MYPGPGAKIRAFISQMSVYTIMVDLLIAIMLRMESVQLLLPILQLIATTRIGNACAL